MRGSKIPEQKNLETENEVFSSVIMSVDCVKITHHSLVTDLLRIERTVFTQLPVEIQFPISTNNISNPFWNEYSSP